ncbi:MULTISPECIES: type II toxin-antitoxin system Phd/YefM family antitoxin [Streptosporangium]|uniref:Antitoxin n=1 Tax=Streptosporangium brasiliense TaxID=47480 RepID=A0ABT9R0G6_9ACTN|nr:type II toxin-antitoxin system Phd/YefM family antitoxin [Streptosporangium brasiliense]MDP9862709.1 prevent-host-death family protein [Streptosporangium brasiliense]
MAEEIPVTQARADFAELVNRAAYGGERIVMTRHGKPLVALVPAADLERLESMERQASETVLRLGAATYDAESRSAGSRRIGIAAEHRPPREPGRP